VKEVDFGPTGAWYIHAIRRNNTGAQYWWGQSKADSHIEKYSAEAPNRLQVSFGSDRYGRETYAILIGQNECILSSNLNNDLKERVERLQNQNKAIKFIRLFAADGYFISDDEGTESGNVAFGFAGVRYRDGVVVDIAKAGDGPWVVNCLGYFDISMKVDFNIRKHLEDFDRAHQKRVREAKFYIAHMAVGKVEKLEEILEDRLLEEVERFRELEELVKKRKRTLQAYIQELPASKRVLFERLLET